MKICTKCKVAKLESEFYKNKSNKLGLSCQCKDCMKQYKQEHKKENSKYQQQYQQDNKEERRKYHKQWYQKNGKEIAKHRQDHKNEAKKYRQEHRNESRKRTAERLKNDIQFHLARRLRSRLYDALRNKQKVGSAVGDLGCTIAELIVHLESQFRPGMTWDNRNKWHIDHIRPLASFDLTDRNQLLAACNWKNLQPLWAHENQSKGDKY